MRFRSAIVFFLIICIGISCRQPVHKPAIVFQTDFGLKDGAVSAMKGVASGVDPELRLFDLTHEIPAYNIWEAAYRLDQTAPYWPAGTVFVSVVDPGVGTNRHSVVLKTRNGQYFVGPDNGSLTLVAEHFGIAEIRQIDEAVNRRQASGSSYTFHGRDVYAFTAARLASGTIRFEEVGPRLADSVVTLEHQPAVLQDGRITGMIPILDIQYGNIWTNIPDSLVKAAGINYGDSVTVHFFHNNQELHVERAPLVTTFGAVPEKAALFYYNSLMQFSIALNMANYADTHKISSGPGWTVRLSKLP